MSLRDYYADRQAFDTLKQGYENNELARQAGGMIADGNATGGANVLFRGGRIEAGQAVRTHADAQHKSEVEFAGKLAEGVGKRAQAKIKAGMDSKAAYDEAMGEGEQFAASRGMSAHMPALRQQYEQMGGEAFTQWLGGAAQKEWQYFQNEHGITGVNKNDPTDRVSVEKYAPKPVVIDGFAYLPEEVPEPRVGTPGINPNAPDPRRASTGTATQDTGGNTVPPPPAPPEQTEATWRKMIQRESGGNGDAVSPQGAIGSTQMLPATAQSMAQKLGVQWRPDLMRGNSPQALAYQGQLGRAYYDEGLEKYNGDTRMAAMYYHGGPDQRIWGPKTRAYGDAVAGPGGGNTQLQGGDGSDSIANAPQIPGYRVIGRAKGDGQQWRDDGHGGLIGSNGDKKRDPTFAGSQGHMATAADKSKLGLPADAPYWIDEDGKPSAIGGEKPNKPLTEYQGKSVEYLNAALGGNDRMNDLASRGLYKPRTATDSLFTKPDKDGVKRLVLRTDEDRQFMQAAKEWLAPILRKDTGAAVTDSELAYYMDIYIPKFEDSPRVMWQKAQARDKKMSALYGANRGSYDSTFGAPARWQVLTDPRGVPAKAGGAPGKSAGPAKPAGRPPLSSFQK